MGQNILITGAAGYIGGTVFADFISRTSGPLKGANISAAVRTEEQVRRLSKLHVNVIQIDLSNETAVTEVVLHHEIDIVIHLASSMEPHLASHLIKALGHRRTVSGEEVFFIHSAVTALFAAENRWPYGQVKDTDPTIFEKEKQLQIERPDPVRETDVLVTEQAQEQGVTSLIVVVPVVYGTGKGEYRKLSSAIPSFIRSSIKHKLVYKFDKDASPPAVHVSDLTALYAQLSVKILQKEPVPNGKGGYYFGFAHRAPWWEVMQRLAQGLYARGLVLEPEPKIWPSDEFAAESLGWPPQYARAMGTNTPDLVAINPYQVGWQPKWDQEKFLKSIDDEIQAALEFDTVRPSIYDALMPKNK